MNCLCFLSFSFFLFWRNISVAFLLLYRFSNNNELGNIRKSNPRMPFDSVALLSLLEEGKRHEIVSTFFQANLSARNTVYTVEELLACVKMVSYPPGFWDVLGQHAAFFIKFTFLWTEEPQDCFTHLKSIMVYDESARMILPRYADHFLEGCVEKYELSFEDLCHFLELPQEGWEAYAESIGPRSESFLERKKVEYARMMRSSDEATAMKGMEMGVNLLYRHYHSCVCEYMFWPAKLCLILALLEDELQWRDYIYGCSDKGWVPRNYISLCRLPREAD